MFGFPLRTHHNHLNDSQEPNAHYECQAPSVNETSCHLQLIHWVPFLGALRQALGGGVPHVQRPSPQTHLHVPGAPAILFVLVGGGGMDLGVSEVPRRCTENPITLEAQARH